MNIHDFTPVRTVFRGGTLLNFSPTLDPSFAKKIALTLSEKWYKLETDFRDIIACVMKVPTDLVLIAGHHIPRIRLERETLVLDYPRFRIKGETRSPCDLRICIAICTTGKSTKVWCRTGLPLNESEGQWVGLADLRGLTSLYREISTNLISLAEDALRETVGALFDNLEISSNGRIEISATGVKEKHLADLFYGLSTSTISADTLLKDDKTKEGFSKIFQMMSSDDYNVEDFLGEQNTGVWFSTSIGVEVAHGEFETREVLYSVRALNGTAQALGLGYDDSFYGDLSYRSVLRAARWIGRRI